MIELYREDNGKSFLLNLESVLMVTVDKPHTTTIEYKNGRVLTIHVCYNSFKRILQQYQDTKKVTPP